MEVVKKICCINKFTTFYVFILFSISLPAKAATLRNIHITVYVNDILGKAVGIAFEAQ